MDFDPEFKNKIREMAKAHKLYIKTEQNPNEASTEINLIEPIIKGLLNFTGLDITKEFDVSFSKGDKGRKVDYGIKKNGKYILIIEAKKHSLLFHKDDKILEQLLLYSCNALKHYKIKIAILTDGNRWLFYNVADDSDRNFLDF